MLQYPNFTQEFFVTTDAFDYAIGAILSQETLDQDKQIAYASRNVKSEE